MSEEKHEDRLEMITLTIFLVLCSMFFFIPAAAWWWTKAVAFVHWMMGR